MYEDFPQKRRTPLITGLLEIFSSINRAHACNSDSAVLVSSPWCFRPRSSWGSARCPPGGSSSDSGVAPSKRALEMEGVNWGDQNGNQNPMNNEWTPGKPGIKYVQTNANGFWKSWWTFIERSFKCSWKRFTLEQHHGLCYRLTMQHSLWRGLEKLWLPKPIKPPRLPR